MFLIQQPHTIRKGMVDCFNAFMVDGAEMSTPNDIPICYSTMQTPPKKVITYEEAKNSTDYDATVVFFKDDYKFDGSQILYLFLTHIVCVVAVFGLLKMVLTL